MTLTQEDRESAERTIVALLAEATAVEASRIMSAALRAGLMWRCSDCKQPNYPAAERCAHCGCTASRLADDINAKG